MLVPWSNDIVLVVI